MPPLIDLRNDHIAGQASLGSLESGTSRRTRGRGPKRYSCQRSHAITLNYSFARCKDKYC